MSLLGKDIEMSKRFGNCQICREEMAVVIWRPFAGGYQFSPAKDLMDSEDSIVICKRCENRVLNIKRSDEFAFSEVVTVGDCERIVRKVFRL